MKLACNISKFNCGIEKAIELIQPYNFNSLEMNLANFKVKSNEKLTKTEISYFKKLLKTAHKANLTFDIINFNECIDEIKKNSLDQELNMFKKLVYLAKILDCHKIGVYINPDYGSDWQTKIINHLTNLNDIANSNDLKLLLRLSTPSNFRKSSMSNWRATNPQIWRELIASIEGLCLSFSPADCVWLGINYLDILPGIVAAIENVEAFDIEINRTLLSDSGLFGPLWWQYRMAGKGLVDWRQLIETLKLYNYDQTVSIQLEDDFLEETDTEYENGLKASIKILKPLIK